MFHIADSHSAATASRLLEGLLETRLYREENQSWIEKAVITRVWVGTSGSDSENPLDSLQELFERVSRNTKFPLSAPATHAAQTVSEDISVALASPRPY